MPFGKGNTLWKKGLEARKLKDKKILDLLLGVLEDGGAKEYGAKLEKLADGTKLTEPEIDFMNRYERLMQFLRPKLARKELTGRDGKELVLNLSVGDEKDKEKLKDLGYEE